MRAELRRARPWLGTLVAIGVTARSNDAALAAIDAAFEEIAAVHHLMSFHSADSDLARMNRDAATRTVRVDPRTREVLELALAFARESEGSFDPTVAAELVDWRLLPWPSGATRHPIPGASFRDVELIDDCGVRFAKPLWLDFGGIAKGYAVDRAIDCLVRAGIRVAQVNAGGDLSLMGETSQIVHLRSSATTIVPVLELRQGSVATSSGIRERGRWRGWRVGPHLDGRLRRVTGRRKTVSVVADRCAVADALTKIVLADVQSSEPILARHRATACIVDSRHGYRVLGR